MSKYTSKQVRLESAKYLDERDADCGDLIQMLEAYAADLDKRETREPVAWLIKCKYKNGRRFRAVYEHNCIADFRDADPNATSTPLYAESVPLD